jgi:nucleoside-diphosphate-sugar epimerase
MARGLAPLVGARDGRLSLVYVDDLADALVALVARGATGRTFELHDGRPSGYAVADIVAAVERWRGRRIVRVPVPAAVVRVAARANTLAARLRGRAPMLTPGKARELFHPAWTCDNATLTAATGWRPRFGLDEGLRRTRGDPGSRRARTRVLAQC